MIYNELLEWIKSLPYWQQRIAEKIIKTEIMGTDDYDEIYELFKSENGLIDSVLTKTNIVFPETVSKEENVSEVYWKGLQNTKGINALKNGEALEIEKGLNLLYGENGSGKSGYTRLLNNAFASKGDKNLIPNIYESTHEDVYAQFKFQEENHEIILKYPVDKENVMFKRIMVFDTQSAIADMKSESELSFVPSEFYFFDKLLEAVAEIEKRLESEIAENTKENPFLVFFEKKNSIKDAIVSINDKTNIADLEKYALSEDEKLLAKEASIEKAKLIALNIAERSQKLNLIRNEVLKIVDSVDEINLLFKKETIEKLKEILSNIYEAEQLSKREGIEQFKDDDIEKIGSKEWKEFLNAAKKYYKAIGEDVKKCIFCGQSIEGIQLIDKYWLYLESVAEKNLETLRKILKEKSAKYGSLRVQLPGIETSCGEWMLSNCQAEYEKLKVDFDSVERQKVLILSALDEEKWDAAISETQIRKKILEEIVLKINEEIQKLKESEISQRIEELSAKELDYKDREKVVQLLPHIKEYIEKLKWVALGNKKKIKTRTITNKQKELFTKYVTDDYISIFEAECKKLNADFSAEIVQRGSKGTMLKKIAIKGETPGNILSEGEQRAICIANFLAEAITNSENIAIVFDDPVCSLDHNRRRIIAERLVEESKRRQVIIFTHDITFLMEVKTICEKMNLTIALNTVRKVIDKPGCISKVIPWQSMSVKERIKKLNSELQDIQKLEKQGDIDTYFYRVKVWCELLRESWERAIEEILLNDAIQRFNPCVQTQRLAKAPFTLQLYEEVEKGMTECSLWVHDRVRELNAEIPTTNVLKKYIDTFSEFVKNNRPK